MTTVVHDPALEAAYRGLRRGLLAFLRQRVEDAATAEDLLQTIFTRAIAADTPVRSHDKLASWLYAIARNAVVDHYRTRRATEPLPDDLADSRGEEDAARRALAACLRPLAGDLPEGTRDVLIAAEFEEKPLQAVADGLGLSLAAVKTRASRGRRMLKERLLACCEIERSASGAVADYRLRGAGAGSCWSRCGCL